MASRVKLNVKCLVKFSSSVLALLFYCEFLHYYVVLSQCRWGTLDPATSTPNITDGGTELHAMVIADTHLLGKINGHWFDKLRREWQMHRTFQTAVTLHKPKLFIFLGDLFDEGKWCRPEEFAEYVAHFYELFPVPGDSHLLIAVGNHDVGFHYSVTPYLVSRFEQAFDVGPVKLVQLSGVTFIIINSMALEGDDCFLCRPAVNKIRITAKQLKCAAGDKDACKYWHNPDLHQYSQPIILQHYPLYRDSDSVCHEPDEAPPEIKYNKFRERWECISKASTKLLLGYLSPRVVLSGHTHHGCHVTHNTSQGSTIHEYTIPSFSWRNKRSPTFSMLTVSPSNYAIYKCHMPKETTIFAIYGSFFILLLVLIIRKIIQREGILYVKISNHLD